MTAGRRFGRRLPTPAVVAFLIVALLAGGVVRTIAMHRRGETGSSAGVAQLDSYALGLLLGGLRGPLVMSLWAGVEGDRMNRRYEDLNTKIELIRLLQPQFDAVHEFQIWNKAYNLSAAQATLAGRYASILDALAYAGELDRGERQDSLAIKSALSRTFAQKLGQSVERLYYDRRLRDDTSAPDTRVTYTFPADRRAAFEEAARRAGVSPSRLTFRGNVGEAGGRRTSVTVRGREAADISAEFSGDDVTTAERADTPTGGTGATTDRARYPTLLDESGDLLPPGELPMPGGLAHLRAYEPFPQGVGAYALAYDYARQALRLSEAGQAHPSLTDRVLSRDVPLALWNWSEAMWRRGRVAEAEHYRRRLPGETVDLEGVTAAAPPPEALTPLLSEAIWSYERSARLARDARAGFLAHIDEYPADARRYEARLLFLTALEAFTTADATYLRLGLEADEGRRRALAERAALGYGTAQVLFGRSLARFYSTDDVLEALGYTPGGFAADEVSPADALAFVDAARRKMVEEGVDYEFGVEANLFTNYVDRAAARLVTLRDLGLLAPPPATTRPGG